MLAALVVGVGAGVNDALGVVRVAVLREAAGEGRGQRIRHVDHVEAGAAGARADADHEVTLGQGHDVVRVTELRVDGVGAEHLSRASPRAQAGQVEDLDAVAAGLADDVGVVANGFHVAPERVAGARGQAPEPEWRRRRRHVDKRDPIRRAHQRVLAAGVRIGPAPDVVALGTRKPEGREAQDGL